MPFADVAGRPISYVRSGDRGGEPLLLIQGLSGTHATWGEPFMELLRPGIDVIAYDHRGIGESGPLDGPFTIADLASDAAGLLDALGIERAHVVGISMGGMVAQELALGHPGRVRTITLGCTYCGGPDSRITDQETIGRLLAAISSGDRELVLRTSFEVNVSPAYAAQPGSWETFRFVALEVPAPVPVVFEQMRARASHDTSARLPGLTVPALVIHGDLDAMLDVHNGEQVARLIPGAQLEILPGVGHLFWWERPEASAALIRGHAGVAAPVAPQ